MLPKIFDPRVGLTLLMVALVLGLSMLPVMAQDDPVPTATSEPSATPTLTLTPQLPISVRGLEPTYMAYGNETVLSILGSNFTASTTVRLVGYGFLDTTLINTTALRAIVPGSVIAGTYQIEVNEPGINTAYAPSTFTVLGPTATPRPTNEPIPTGEPIPSREPSTPVPGQPSLLIRRFTTTPEVVAPGGTVNLSFEVVNQGTRPAQGVSMNIGSGSGFVPANGTTTSLLPDIGAGQTVAASISAIVPLDAAGGANSVPISLNYRDFSAQTYSTDTSVSVMVAAPSGSSQVVIVRYTTSPSPVVPGEPVTVTVWVVNSGNRNADQVLLRLGGDGVLLAGPEGDSFTLGDLAAGGITARDLSLVLSTNAEFGPQSQSITISYLQGDERVTVDSSLTVLVARSAQLAPLMLLTEYDAGKDILRPGEIFTLTMTLQNEGNAAANNLRVTYGSVASTDDGTGSGSDSTTPSTIFAPLGTGGTTFVGTIEPDGGNITLSQDFIVSGTVASGIYNLPITLRYENADGDVVQDNLSASIVVVTPPLLQISLPSPLPETVNAGEPLFLSVSITNMGTKTVNFTVANVAADNADVADGAEITVGALPKEEDTSVDAMIVPLEEGPVTITLSLHYLDDLGYQQTIEQIYQTEAVAPPPPPEDFGPGEPEPTPEPVEEEKPSLARRIVLGLMGLGS
jgi:hypothetical protein